MSDVWQGRREGRSGRTWRGWHNSPVCPCHQYLPLAGRVLCSPPRSPSDWNNTGSWAHVTSGHHSPTSSLTDRLYVSVCILKVWRCFPPSLAPSVRSKAGVSVCEALAPILTFLSSPAHTSDRLRCFTSLRQTTNISQTEQRHPGPDGGSPGNVI